MRCCPGFAAALREGNRDDRSGELFGNLKADVKVTKQTRKEWRLPRCEFCSSQGAGVPFGRAGVDFPIRGGNGRPQQVIGEDGSCSRRCVVFQLK